MKGWIEEGPASRLGLPFCRRRQLVCFGPTLPTWAMQQVGSYPGVTGHDANVAAK